MSIAFHLLVAGWILTMAWLANDHPQRYRMLMQEDRVIEWATVWLFLAASVLGLVWSIRRRRLFDGLVALFCLFVAGEEMSWGQRLIGYAPPEFFLANNFQQELTLHNLPQSVQPGWFLMAALAGYGVLLPLLAQAGSPRRFLARVGATPPSLALMPWYVAAILLLWEYPFSFTGEWVELLAGGLFVMSTGPIPTVFWAIVATAVAFGATMTPLAGALERGRDESRIACARAEVQSLADDVAAGEAGMGKLWEMRRVHKRVWSSISEDYIDSGEFRLFNAAACPDSAGASAEVRRRFGIDPWGTSYWLLVERDTASGHQVTVYSFGPNRRRDVDQGGVNPEDGDDVVATPRERD